MKKTLAGIATTICVSASGEVCFDRCGFCESFEHDYVKNQKIQNMSSEQRNTNAQDIIFADKADIDRLIDEQCPLLINDKYILKSAVGVSILDNRIIIQESCDEDIAWSKTVWAKSF